MIWEGYKVGDVITFESGVSEITIYNAAESGPLEFDVSFSAAASLLAAATAISAVLSFWEKEVQVLVSNTGADF